jgi:hypothetical protein
MSELARSQGSWTSLKDSLALTLDNCQHISQRQNSDRDDKQLGAIKNKSQAAEGNWRADNSSSLSCILGTLGRNAINVGCSESGS